VLILPTGILTVVTVSPMNTRVEVAMFPFPNGNNIEKK
jgi:hypothetical protein